MSTKQPFPLGHVVATPGANEMFGGKFMATCLERHAAGDWGELPPEDRAANDDALKHGDRLFSSYKHRSKGELWIITEADRSVTTALLPEDY